MCILAYITNKSIISEVINPDFFPFKKNLNKIQKMKVIENIMDNGKKISCNGIS